MVDSELDGIGCRSGTQIIHARLQTLEKRYTLTKARPLSATNQCPPVPLIKATINYDNYFSENHYCICTMLSTNFLKFYGKVNKNRYK